MLDAQVHCHMAPLVNVEELLMQSGRRLSEGAAGGGGGGLLGLIILLLIVYYCFCRSKNRNREFDDGPTVPHGITYVPSRDGGGHGILDLEDPQSPSQADSFRARGFTQDSRGDWHRPKTPGSANKNLLPPYASRNEVEAAGLTWQRGGCSPNR